MRRMRGGKAARPVEDLRKLASHVRRHVEHQEERSRKVARKLAYETLERLDAAGGGANDHNISMQHRLSQSPGPIDTIALLQPFGGWAGAPTRGAGGGEQ